jgi:hypothetical protein
MDEKNGKVAKNIFSQARPTAGFILTPNWALGGLMRLKVT